MKYVIGLGNPGERYEGTRHNIGRDIVTETRVRLDFPEFSYYRYAKSFRTQGEVSDSGVMLLLPETYMNLSGESLVSFLPLGERDEIVVVHDDLDLAFGTFKFSHDRGSGGHNGVESIARTLKSTAFTRLRVGIDLPSSSSSENNEPLRRGSSERFVLSRFSHVEREGLGNVIDRSVEALITYLREGRERAMNIYN